MQRPVPRQHPVPEPSSGLVRCDDGLFRPAWATTSAMLQRYYDEEWGVPVMDERGIFERICLETFQSGLSWATILNKREAFRAAFEGFAPERVSRFTRSNVDSLLQNPGIVRNRRKIEATINNAAATERLRERGGLVALIWSFVPATRYLPVRVADIPAISAESTAMAIALRAEGFSFVGPTTMHALMEAIGLVNAHVVGSHRRDAVERMQLAALREMNVQGPRVQHER